MGSVINACELNVVADGQIHEPLQRTSCREDKTKQGRNEDKEEEIHGEKEGRRNVQRQQRTEEEDSCVQEVQLETPQERLTVNKDFIGDNVPLNCPFPEPPPG